MRGAHDLASTEVERVELNALQDARAQTSGLKSTHSTRLCFPHSFGQTPAYTQLDNDYHARSFLRMALTRPDHFDEACPPALRTAERAAILDRRQHNGLDENTPLVGVAL